MRYANARDIFPEELVETIQRYVDGEYIYIPRREDNKKGWGYRTDSRQVLSERNQRIYNEYCVGASVRQLAETYYLSIKSIQRIVLQMKRKHPH